VGEHASRPFFSLEFLPRRQPGPAPQRHAAAARRGGIPWSRRWRGAVAGGARQGGAAPRPSSRPNVLLAADGTPKVTDFGLAKKLDDVGHTQTGAHHGHAGRTWAPEQASGKVREVGAGGGRGTRWGPSSTSASPAGPPSRGRRRWTTLLMVQSDEPVPVTRLQPKVPRDLETICLKCLRKEAAPALRRRGGAGGRPGPVPARRAGAGPPGRGRRERAVEVVPAPPRRRRACSGWRGCWRWPSRPGGVGLHYSGRLQEALRQAQVTPAGGRGGTRAKPRPPGGRSAGKQRGGGRENRPARHKGRKAEAPAPAPGGRASKRPRPTGKRARARLAPPLQPRRPLALSAVEAGDPAPPPLDVLDSCNWNERGWEWLHVRPARPPSCTRCGATTGKSPASPSARTAGASSAAGRGRHGEDCGTRGTGQAPLELPGPPRLRHLRPAFRPGPAGPPSSAATSARTIRAKSASGTRLPGAPLLTLRRPRGRGRAQRPSARTAPVVAGGGGTRGRSPGEVLLW